MTLRTFLTISLFALMLSAPASAQIVPPGEKAPVLRLEAGEPTAYVTSLGFSPDGKRLYAAGLDKVVRVWSLDESGMFRLSPVAYRVPLAPGVHGYINAIAVSPDGTRLAVGGQGVFRGLAGFGRAGYGWPVVGALNEEMRQDQGMIYVFNINDNSVRLLRGHTGPVLGLAFAPARARGRKPALLVSAGLDWNSKRSRFEGALRLWDTEEGTALATQGGQTLDLRKVVRPDLATWYSGDGAREVRVAFSWGDGQLRVWDVDGGRLLEKNDGRSYLRATYLARSDRVLTAASNGDTAHLQTWRTSGTEPPAVEEGGTREDTIDALPWALAQVASEADGETDHVAAVVRMQKKRDEVHLHVYDLRRGRFGELRADRLLWQGDTQASLATSPRGKYLAVAGGGDHTILVYSIADLLAKKGDPQHLRSQGETFRDVGFTVKGKERGLVLRTRARAQPGDPPPTPREGNLLFDFDNRRPTTDREGWKADVPDTDGWRVKWSGTVEGGGRETLTVTEGDKEPVTIRLYQDYSLSDYALLPGRAPLLAVASHRRGQPMLALYHARTGDQLRNFSGHADRITAVAFSSDGRLLASTGEDQTVCVWSLTNLDQIVGKHGLLRGVAVKGDDGAVVVDRVDTDSPLRTRLKAGDVIEAVVEDDKPKELTRPDALYEAVDRKNPGESITLRIRGRGDVTVKVGQGFDTRNPLLSLFITRGEEVADRQWIGWSPLGPYDVSGMRAELLLGWHLNTGRAEAPTQFAPAGAYRKQFYRPGILKEMIARGELPPTPAPMPMPPPEMGLLIEDDGVLPRPDDRGVLPARGERVTLRLNIAGRDPDTLGLVTWSLDGGEAEKFETIEGGGRELSAPLKLDRGTHRLRVIARARDEPDEYARELQVRYQPPAPIVKLIAPDPDERVMVRKSEFRFRATARPGRRGEKLKVIVRHTQEGRELLRTEPDEKDGELGQDLKLEPGDNTIEILAVNRDALKDYEGAETTRQSVVVNYRKKDEAPRITLKRLVPVGDGREITITDGVLVLTVPQVRVEGEITATATLTKAQRFIGETGKELEGFALGRRTFTVAEKIDLKPGEQTLRFIARTEDSDPAERSLRIEYRPQVPPIAEISPEGPVKLVEGKDAREIKISGKLGTADNKQPFRSAILVNGKESSAKIEIDEGAFTARVPIGAGLSQLVVELSNEWGSASRREIEVRYVRPPRITSWRGPEKATTPLVTLVAEVDSALPLRRETVRADVNGNSLADYELLKPEEGSPRTWRLRVRNVLLGKKGENVVTLSVANDDERSESSTWRVQYDPPSPPEVSIIEPARDGAIEVAEIRVRVRVKSETPIQKAILVREGKGRWDHTFDPDRFTKEGDHYLSPPIMVPLEEGPNAIRAEVANKGGANQDTRRISYLAPPVVLEITELSDRGGLTQKPELRDGELVIPKAMPGRVKLRGRVVWAKADDERLSKPATVRIYVNGFQQVPVDLPRAETGSRSRIFERDIILNRDKSNRIEVALADLPGLAGMPTRCMVDCSSPVRAQRLHLLIVSAEKVDPAALEKQFLDAFRAKTGGSGVLMAPSFDRVIVYGPLVGDNAHHAYVSEQLVRIHQEIKGNARSSAAGNDVVVFYFKGGETFTGEDGHSFYSTGRKTRSKVVSFRRLIDLFADTPGAQVLLFDVDREPAKDADAGRDRRDEVARWEDFHRDVRTHVAVLRYAWLGGPRGDRDPMLLETLQSVLPETSLLLDVTNRLRRKVGGDDKLLYHPRVPEELKDLRVGARR